MQLTAAAREFGFDDKQKDVYLGGYLMAAFFIVGAPSALLVSAAGAASWSQDVPDHVIASLQEQGDTHVASGWSMCVACHRTRVHQ